MDKNVSKAKNSTYSVAMILLVLIVASYGGHSINSKAISPDADTVFYRINPDISSMEKRFWQFGLEFLRKNSQKSRRNKCYILVDETYDSYTGKLLKKEKKKKDKLTQKEKEALRYIHKYKPKDGDTGSYKYLVFAVLYGSKRRVIRIKALKRKENYKTFIVKTLIEIRAIGKFECAIFDRGFYDGKFFEALKKTSIPFICRARISKTMKKEYGFYKKWKCYRDFEVGKSKSKADLVLGADYSQGKRTKWAFITNLEYKNWQNIREIYRKRWNIENIFKATDGIQLRVQTNNPKTRMFCICLSFLLYNTWQKKHKHARPTLNNYIIEIIESILKKIIKTTNQFLQHYRDKLKIRFPFWDKIISST